MQALAHAFLISMSCLQNHLGLIPYFTIGINLWSNQKIITPFVVKLVEENIEILQQLFKKLLPVLQRFTVFATIVALFVTATVVMYSHCCKIVEIRLQRFSSIATKTLR